MAAILRNGECSTCESQCLRCKNPHKQLNKTHSDYVIKKRWSAIYDDTYHIKWKVSDGNVVFSVETEEKADFLVSELNELEEYRDAF